MREKNENEEKERGVQRDLLVDKEKWTNVGKWCIGLKIMFKDNKRLIVTSVKYLGHFDKG